LEALLEKNEPEQTLVTSPDLNKLGDAFQGPTGIRSLALTGLFILACFYTLYFARDFFFPIVLAVVFMFLLSPLVRGLKRARIPEAVGAAVVILSLFALLAGIFYQFAGPVTQWMQTLPAIGQKLQGELRRFEKPLGQVTKAGEQMQRLTTLGPADQKKAPQQVEIKQPGLIDGIFSRTTSFLFGLMVVVILLYFLLASGDLFLRKLIHVLPRFQDKRKAVQIAREVEDNISTYLLTVAIINACLGTAGGVVFWLLGMPDPWLWGALAAVMNFIPYLGALSVICITGVVAAATFPSLGHALLVPGAYLALSIIEGNFVNPWIVGRRLTLNPVVIFLALTFWGWLWGIPGALLAVPMLAMFKIFCDHIEPLAPIGEFLGH
jgi:predicted PurR-regulated permease PerM